MVIFVLVSKKRSHFKISKCSLPYPFVVAVIVLVGPGSIVTALTLNVYV